MSAWLHTTVRANIGQTGGRVLAPLARFSLPIALNTLELVRQLRGFVASIRGLAGVASAVSPQSHDYDGRQGDNGCPT